MKQQSKLKSLPKLPEKTWWWSENTSADLIAKRRSALDAALQGLLDLEDVPAIPAVREFLQVPNRTGVTKDVEQEEGSA